MINKVALEIVRSRRKTLCIQVSKANRVTVRAPLRCSQRRIDRFITAHQSWIDKQLDYLQKNPGLPEADFQPGSVLWLLGKPYTIRLTQEARFKVEFAGSELTVKSPRLETAYVTRKLRHWHRLYALEYLTSATAAIHQGTDVELPDFSVAVRKMKRQWGNCSRRGEIKFSLALIQYPPDCIEYVICHELAHLLHFNHSHDFYRLLMKLCPDWKHLKHKLQTFNGM